MNGTAIGQPSGRLDSGKLAEGFFREPGQVRAKSCRLGGIADRQLTGGDEEFIGIRRVVFELTRTKGIRPGAEKRHGWIVWTKHELPFFDRRMDGKPDGGNGLQKGGASFLQPVVALGIVARLSRRDDLPRLKPDAEERMGMAESQPEHATVLMQDHALANAPWMADRAVCADVLKVQVGGMVGAREEKKISAPAVAD